MITSKSETINWDIEVSPAKQITNLDFPEIEDFPY